jgi:prepilin-type N-terminal cleavage/methylation domain-containing protein
MLTKSLFKEKKMNRKGFTLIELLVVIAIIGILGMIVTGVIVGGCCIIKGVNAAAAADEAALVEHEERLISNPPLYAVGDIVYHKASDEKMVVAKNACSWNDVKEGWNIKVKDGGNWDKVGGFGINETEVKLTLKTLVPE